MSEREIDITGDFSIGVFNVYPSKNLIVEADNRAHVTPKVLAVLLALAEKQGETVAKEDLMQAVWGDVATSDMVLSKAISDLRKAFGDTAKKQEFIQTVSKKGYILIKEVKWCKPIDYSKLTTKLSLSILHKPILASTVAGIIILSGILVSNIQEDGGNYARAPTITNLTGDTSEQRHPRFSPNGKFVAYFEKSESNLDKLVLQKIDSGIKKQLKSFEHVSKNGPSKGISFSGDGERLAVRVNYQNRCQIYIIELRSMIERKLEKCPFSTIASIDFTPDGTSVVTTEFKTGMRVVNLVVLEINGEDIKRVGDELHQSGGYLFPRINRTGTKIASIGLIAATSSWSLVVTDLETGKHLTVFQSKRQLNQVVWGENDDVLYFVSHQGTAPGIWKLSLDTFAVTRILNSFHEIIDLDYSVTSGNFIYSELQYNFSIIQKNKDTNEGYIRSPLELPTKNNILPAISPNGLLLAYVSRDFGPDRLFIHSIDGNENKLLFSGAPGRIIDIEWSPNSQQLMASQVNGNNSGIVLIDLKTGAITDMGGGGKIVRGLWSKDGSRKYWKSFDGEQWDLIMLGDDKREFKVAELGLLSDYQVIENGQIIIRRPGVGDKNNRLIRMEKTLELDIESKEHILIANSRLGDWDISDNRIFYILTETNESSLFSMDFEGQLATKIDIIKGEIYNAGSQLSISNDQEKIFVVMKRKIGSDLFLMSK